MVTVDPQVYIDATILVGSALGAAAAALVPYWQKIRENQVLGLPPITFDKKFLGTVVIAFVIGIATAVMSFDTVSAQINVHDTIVKIFIVAVVTSATSNITLNRFLTVSPVATQLSVVKKQNEALQAELESINEQKHKMTAAVAEETTTEGQPKILSSSESTPTTIKQL